MSNHQLKALRAFQDKAGCAHTQGKANRAWRELKPYLTEDQRRKFRIAWSHARLDEGRRELDSVCGRIREAWRASQ